MVGPECPFGLAGLTLAVVLTVDNLWPILVLTPLVLPQTVSLANRQLLIEPFCTLLTIRNSYLACDNLFFVVCYAGPECQ